MADPDSDKPTIPQVFIIESLTLEDEKHQRFEGRILESILALSGKKSIYYYIRTLRELRKIAKEFDNSGFRYLHLSCHGNQYEMGTTFDTVEFHQLGQILRPYLNGRRVFLSACEMATLTLAKELLHDSGCNSVIGPADAVQFSDAALLWSSFYHLCFKTNEKVMQRPWMSKHLRSTASLFNVRLNYFSGDEHIGLTSTVIKP